MTKKQDVTVTDRPEAGRYEALIDGERAGRLDYERSDTAIEFTHTVVEDAYEGRGVASALVRTALEAVRRENEHGASLMVIPTCSFVSSYLAKHPEYADLVS